MCAIAVVQCKVAPLFIRNMILRYHDTNNLMKHHFIAGLDCLDVAKVSLSGSRPFKLPALIFSFCLISQTFFEQKGFRKIFKDIQLCPSMIYRIMIEWNPIVEQIHFAPDRYRRRAHDASFGFFKTFIQNVYGKKIILFTVRNIYAKT
jgi:hypothetical protein